MTVEADPQSLKPTPTRLVLARRIADREVRHYWWVKPTTYWRSDDGGDERKVTDDVREFVDAGLADYGPEDPGGYSTVTLTAAGVAWRKRGAP